MSARRNGSTQQGIRSLVVQLCTLFAQVKLTVIVPSKCDILFFPFHTIDHMPSDCVYRSSAMCKLEAS